MYRNSMSIRIVTLGCIALEWIILSAFRIGMILLWIKKCETVVFTGTTAERMYLWETIETQTIFLDECRAFVNTHLQELNATPDCVLFIRTQLAHRIVDLCLIGLYIFGMKMDLIMRTRLYVWNRFQSLITRRQKLIDLTCGRTEVDQDAIPFRNVDVVHAKSGERGVYVVLSCPYSTTGFHWNERKTEKMPKLAIDKNAFIFKPPH